MVVLSDFWRLFGSVPVQDQISHKTSELLESKEFLIRSLRRHFPPPFNILPTIRRGQFSNTKINFFCLVKKELFFKYRYQGQELIKQSLEKDQLYFCPDYCVNKWRKGLGLYFLKSQNEIPTQNLWTLTLWEMQV